MKRGYYNNKSKGGYGGYNNDGYYDQGYNNSYGGNQNYNKDKQYPEQSVYDNQGNYGYDQNNYNNKNYDNTYTKKAYNNYDSYNNNNNASTGYTNDYNYKGSDYNKPQNYKGGNYGYENKGYDNKPKSYKTNNYNQSNYSTTNVSEKPVPKYQQHNEVVKNQDDVCDDGVDFYGDDAFSDEFNDHELGDNDDDYGGEVDVYGNEINSSSKPYNRNDKTTFTKSSYNPLEFNSKLGFTEYVDQLIGKEYKKYSDINDSYVNVLMIAEKPSIAKAIAVALSDGKSNNKQIGKGKGIITFDGYFQNVRAKFTVSSVMGHVYTSDFKSEHNNWNSVEPIELFDLPIVKLEANKKTRIPSMLSKMAQGKDILALWLDCDKEGENICYETIYCCYKQMNRKDYQQIYRAKFSSLTNIDLKKAMKTIEFMPNSKESSAVDARQHIDLKIGIAFTRFLTTTILPGLNLEGVTLLSYGPCQTPTLWFCVNRENEINSFKSQQIFRVYLEFTHQRIKNKIFLKPEASNLIKLEKGEIFDKKKCAFILDYLKNLKETVCKVVDIKANKASKAAPVGLNTVAMLRTASSYLKLSPTNTMHIAEKLYTSGYITYPRTETTKYTSSFDFFGLLNQLKGIGNKEISNIISNLLTNFKKPVLRGVDVGDHPPITPAKLAVGLTGDQARLYEFIVTHFVATMMESADYEERHYFIDFGGESFQAHTKVLVKEGFLSLFKWKREKYNENYPLLKLNEILPINSIGSDSIWTSPPPNLSESDLLKLMEHHGIGTDASMAVHIENITNRGYVTVDGNRRLKPSNLGRALILGLSSVDEELVIPKLRSEIEKSVTEICKGKKTYTEIMEYSLKSYKSKFILVRQFYDKLFKGFSKYFNMNYGNMTKLIQKMRISNEAENIKDIKQKSITEVKDKILKNCLKCNSSDAKLYVDYHTYDKFVIHCTKCKFREKTIRDAICILVDQEKQCDKCKSFLVHADVENPFLNGDTFIKGCLFCDSGFK